MVRKERIIRTIILPLLLTLSGPIFACGTVSNWMDVYEGSKSGHPWRDMSSRLDALVMLQDCSEMTSLKQPEAKRMLRILTDAMANRGQIILQGSRNYDLACKVGRYKNDYLYEGLIESIFYRFQCLDGAREPMSPTFSNGLVSNPDIVGNLTLYDYFGTSACTQKGLIPLTVKAPSGARLRTAPRTGSRIIINMKNGTALNGVQQVGEWYRVVNPFYNKWQSSRIGYVHQSIVVEQRSE